jgi:hypothetical protein
MSASVYQFNLGEAIPSLPSPAYTVPRQKQKTKGHAFQARRKKPRRKAHTALPKARAQPEGRSDPIIAVAVAVVFPSIPDQLDSG